MGWLKAKCPRCWENHDGLSCEEYGRKMATWANQAEQTRLLHEQNDLIRQQNDLIRQAARKGGNR